MSRAPRRYLTPIGWAPIAGAALGILIILIAATCRAQPTQEDAYLTLRGKAPVPIFLADGDREKLWAEAGREVAFLASKRPRPGPDLSEYRAAMDALVAQHAGTWRGLADSYADPVRLAIDGLWMLSEATQEPRYVALAVELTQRVIAASETVTRSFTSDLRMYAGFRDVARVARSLGVDPGGIEAGVAAMLAHYEARSFCCVDGRSVPFREWALRQHAPPVRLDVPTGFWQGHQTFAARMGGWADVMQAWVADSRDGVWGAGEVEGYPGARSNFKAARDLEMAILHGLPMPPGLWARVYDGQRFHEFVDGHDNPTHLRTYDLDRNGNPRPWHGAVSLAEGWCLLDEARALCRQAIAGTLTGTMGDLNRSTNGTREAAAVGATALGETM